MIPKEVMQEHQLTINGVIETLDISKKPLIMMDTVMHFVIAIYLMGS